MAPSLPVSSPAFQRLLALGISLCTGTLLWLLSIDALPFLKLLGNGFPFAVSLAALAALLTLGVGQTRSIVLMGIAVLVVLTTVGAGRHNVFMLQPEFLALNIGAACIILPFCLAMIENGGQRPTYERLYHHAWSCCLRLGLAGLFTGAFWLLLGLCMLLFNVLNIKLFENIFTSKPFMFIATSLMVGYGITLLGDRDNIIRTLRTLLILVSKALLPLITLIVLAFLVTLPFTGLQPLWDTRFATLLLLTTCATLIALLGATWGDGRSNVIYPMPIAWMIQGGLLLMPVLAVLAGYAVYLRVGQYGWTHDRLYAAIGALYMLLYALGTAWAALRPRNGWLGGLRVVNPVLTLTAAILALLLASPALDARRIAVQWRLQDFISGSLQAEQLDVNYFAQQSGHVGKSALATLRDWAQTNGKEDLLAEVEAAQASDDVTLDIVSAAKPAVALSRLQKRLPALTETANADVDHFYHWLRDSGTLSILQSCLSSETCVLWPVDLDNDGDQDMVALTQIPGCAHYQVFERREQTWQIPLGLFGDKCDNEDDFKRLTDGIRQGQVKLVAPQWQDIQFDANRYHISR